MKKTWDFGQIIHRVCRRVPLIAWGLLPVIRLKDRLGSGLMHETLRERMAVFPARPLTPAGRRRLRRDVWFSFLVYDCPVSEYFLYRFDLLSHAGRCEYITEGEKVDICRRLAPDSVRAVLNDKWRTYQRFRPWFRRDAMKVDGSTSEAEYRAFAAAHPRFIAKPLNESCGHGVMLCDALEDDAGGIPQALRAGFILEELIEQAEAMARFHPASVNTIRCATFLKDGQAHILFTFLRIGRGGSIVDNAGAGGFAASVDPDTGIVVTPGVTEGGLEAICHPDTGEQIVGTRIPRWDEMKAMALEMALSMPELPYISWDLALREDGWVLVEGNSEGQFVCPQFTLRRGLRREMRPWFGL